MNENNHLLHYFSQFQEVNSTSSATSKNWWNRTTLQRFLNRKKCIINQYSQYEVGHGPKDQWNLDSRREHCRPWHQTGVQCLPELGPETGP
ncbi:hypothetical protein Ddc_13647 [Ditylenchus destructor]|nr:hypothetical protein Ddc_13647 [Ditylenchus destructor]